MPKGDTVLRAARRWWRGHRPMGWTLGQHIENPAVNCSSQFDVELALAVANTYVRKTDAEE